MSTPKYIGEVTTLKKFSGGLQTQQHKYIEPIHFTVASLHLQTIVLECVWPVYLFYSPLARVHENTISR